MKVLSGTPDVFCFFRFLLLGKKPQLKQDNFVIKRGPAKMPGLSIEQFVSQFY